MTLKSYKSGYNNVGDINNIYNTKNNNKILNMIKRKVSKELRTNLYYMKAS